MKTRLRKSGFTMVELLLAMGIMVPLMLIVMQVFTQIVEMKLGAEAGSAIATDSRYIYSRLSYDLSRAEEVVLPANPGDEGEELRLVIEGEEYAYYRDENENLVLTRAGESLRVNGAGTRVEGVSFERLGGEEGVQSVSFEIQLASVTTRAQGPVTNVITSTIGIR